MLNAKYRRYITDVSSRPVRWCIVRSVRQCLASAAMAWCLTTLVVLAGCGQPNTKKDDLKQSTLVRKSVRQNILIVGGETITYDEIVKAIPEQDESQNGTPVSLAARLKPAAQALGLEEFKQLAKPMIEQQVRIQISSILLNQAAKRQINKDIDPALERAAEKEWRKFVMRYDGDEAKAEDALKKLGMNRETFKERRKKTILIQYYAASILPSDRPVTYSELVQAYNQMKDEVFLKPAALTFRLIDIEVAKIGVTDPNNDPLTRARALAGQLMERIRAGEDFGELAKQYSNDHRREFGGLWKPKNPKSLAEPYDSLAAQAEKMEPGQVASPIESAGHIFILKLEEKQVESYESLESVQDQVKERVIMDRRRRALETLNEKVKEQASVIETDRFIDYCLEQVYLAGRQ